MNGCEETGWNYHYSDGWCGRKLMYKAGDPECIQFSIDQVSGNVEKIRHQLNYNTDLAVGTNENILKTGAAVQNQLAQVERKVDVALRRKRHKKVGSQISTASTGDISLVSTFDDGEQEIVPFIINIKGELQIAKICFPDMERKLQYFAVGFPDNGMMIILDQKQIRPSNLYREFIAAGVQFNPTLRKTQIEEALFCTIAPRARYTQQQFLIPAKNGWYNGKFYTQDDTCRGLELLPLLRKRMVQAELTAEEINLYFAEMRQIISPQNRILITLTPFAGLLGSMLREGGFKGNICLNIIEAKKGIKQIICSWLQVYERETLFPNRVVTAQSKNEKGMQEIRDGVLVWDGTCEEGSSYEKSTIHSNLAKLVQITTGERATMEGASGRNSIATVLITSEFLRYRGVFNLVFDEGFCDENEIHRHFVKSQAMDAVLISFVKYAEKNQDKIRKLIDGRKKKADESLGLLKIVYEIARRFWQSCGIDFDHELGVPDISKIENLFFENTDMDNFIDNFVKAIRQNISLFQICPKRYGGEYRKFAIVYDDLFLWFPVAVLKKIVSMSGLLPDLSRILLNLKQTEQLICDTEGFSRKLQIGGKRGEYYQIRREFFNKTGSAEIVELGKREN